MRKYIALFLTFCSAFLWGRDVSETMALQMAEYYCAMLSSKESNSPLVKYQQSPERFSPQGKAYLWLVQVSDGWLFVSSNTKAIPVLAHIQSVEKPVYEDMPPAAQALIEGYENYIDRVNNHGENFQTNALWQEMYKTRNGQLSIKSETTEYIGPLINVAWGQTGNNTSRDDCNKPYNKFCPEEDAPNQCNKAAVGCVAVAIGQIMWYWKWPYAAYVPTTVGGNITEFHFYDWDKMPASIYSSTPMDKVDMVTSFLKDCGYMADMDYGVSSGASDGNAEDALVSFGYNDDSIHLITKLVTPGWTNILHNEIDNGRPVYYSGQSSLVGGGHAFVVDGYKKGNEPVYHINFGWRGNSNGWFNIDESTGYDYYQNAIVGIQPSTVCTDITLSGSLFFPPKFCYAVGGELRLTNATLSNIVQGKLYSATQVKLTNRVSIREGSNVHIAIKPVPCASETNHEPMYSAPKRKNNDVIEDYNTNQNISILPNPAHDFLTVSSSENLDKIAIYNLNGQCVLQTNHTEINISELTSGVYLLRALTEEGKQCQAKFIKQ